MYAYNTLYHGTSGIYVPHSPYITIRTVTSKILKNKTKICLSICTLHTCAQSRARCILCMAV